MRAMDADIQDARRDERSADHGSASMPAKGLADASAPLDRETGERTAYTRAERARTRWPRTTR
jgi:hypothetical protein